MQQLIGDKLGSVTDTNSFLWELFLQRLPASVRMVLASADAMTKLGKQTEMADKLMEVVAPTVAAISDNSATPPTPQQSPNPGAYFAATTTGSYSLDSLAESLVTQPHHCSSSKHHRRSAVTTQN